MNVADLIWTPGAGPMGVACVVTVPPDGVDDPIGVEWISPPDVDDPDDRAVLEQGVRWVSRDERAPAPGDAALLLTDSRGDPWALVWATGGPLMIDDGHGAADEVIGQGVATGAGSPFADVVVQDNLGTAAKLGQATHHSGGTYTADVTVVAIISTTEDTSTFRVFTRNNGNITIGETVLIDYRVWLA